MTPTTVSRAGRRQTRTTFARKQRQCRQHRRAGPVASCSRAIARLACGVGVTTMAGTPTGRAASTATAPAAIGSGGVVVTVRARPRQCEEQPTRGRSVRESNSTDPGHHGGRVGYVVQRSADDLGDRRQGQFDHTEPFSCGCIGECVDGLREHHSIVERVLFTPRIPDPLRDPCPPRARRHPARPPTAAAIAASAAADLADLARSAGHRVGSAPAWPSGWRRDPPSAGCRR